MNPQGDPTQHPHKEQDEPGWPSPPKPRSNAKRSTPAEIRREMEIVADIWAGVYEASTPEFKKWREEAMARLLAEEAMADVLAKSNITKVPRNPPQELVQLAELITTRAHQLTVVDDMPPIGEQNLELKLILATLTEIIHEARDIRREIVVRSVVQGDLTRKQAAEILGVHWSTITEWVKEDTPLAEGSTPTENNNLPPKGQD
jgi:hypothetical protein